MLPPSTSPTPSASVPAVLKAIRANPKTIRTIGPEETVHVLRLLMDTCATPPDITAVVLAVVYSQDPTGFNELVAWAAANNRLPTVRAAVSRFLYSNQMFRKNITKLLLDQKCAAAASILDNRASC